MKLAPGDVVGGTYRIVRLLGKGGMGSVYEGQPSGGSAAVAIKVLHGHLADNKRSVVRFEREAQAAGRIGSTHIVRVHEVGELPDGSPFMVMDLCVGETLRQRLKRCGAMSPQALCAVVTQLLDGLHVAHQAGIIHRDLKPDNVFLSAATAGQAADFVKILDFGVSKLLGGHEGEAITQTGDMLGTPYFMAPEQAKGERGIDHRVDIYAVGVLMFRALAGRYPYRGSNAAELFIKVLTQEAPDLRSVASGVDATMAQIVHRAMARAAADRYSSAADLAVELRAWQPTGGVTAAADPAAAPSRTEVMEAVDPQQGSAHSSTALASAAAPAPPSAPQEAAAPAPPLHPEPLVSLDGARPSHGSGAPGSWQHPSSAVSWSGAAPSAAALPGSQIAQTAPPRMSPVRRTAALGCGMIALLLGLLFAGCSVIRLVDVGWAPARIDLADLVTKPEGTRVRLRALCMLNDVERVAGTGKKCYFPLRNRADAQLVSSTPRDYSHVRVLAELSCSEMDELLGSKAVVRALPKTCKLDVLWSPLGDHSERKRLRTRFSGIDQAIVVRPYRNADVAVFVGAGVLALLLLGVGIGLSIKLIRN